MKKTAIIIIFSIILLISVSLVNAQNTVELLLRDLENQELNNIIVNSEIGNQTMQQNILFGNSLILDIPNGRHELLLKVDNPVTIGKDYFKKTGILVQGNITKNISLAPVGSLRGIVKDKLDNVVPNAELKFECIDEIGSTFPTMSDKFGSFSVDYMPTCSCKIFAKYGKGIGYKELNIAHGVLEDIEINLDTSITSSGSYIFYFILILIILIAIVLYTFRKKLVFKKRGEAKKEPAKRIKDILCTLNSKEQAIVNYLLQHNNQSAQANIRHAIGIPRTSLSRLLKSLEIKKIISIEKHGKAIKIRLTEWFLGKI